MTPRVPMREIPFGLAFEMEVVIPIEIGVPSARIENYDEQTNLEKLHANLDQLEEVRERAHVWMAAYQHKIARYYNFRVRSKIFRVGDLIFRKAEVSQPGERGKLAPNWENPYIVDEIIKLGTYRLKQLDGTALSQPWNSENLRIYFQ
ncbi:uncharacterized protein [Elaeis guineensis]|uniref:uncharacterized protein n=1 Tax=Elaeis guineensis var. tenera TaxID=51953 RepID=UPI003C6CCC60